MRISHPIKQDLLEFIRGGFAISDKTNHAAPFVMNPYGMDQKGKHTEGIKHPLMQIKGCEI